MGEAFIYAAFRSSEWTGPRRSRLAVVRTGHRCDRSQRFTLTHSNDGNIGKSVDDRGFWLCKAQLVRLI